MSVEPEPELRRRVEGMTGIRLDPAAPPGRLLADVVEATVRVLEAEHARERADAGRLRSRRGRLTRDGRPEDDDVALPAPTGPRASRRVFLHVGTPKSGTTYVQNVLWRNWTRLAQAGLLLPGQTYAAHVRAGRAVADPPRPDRLPGVWRGFVAEGGEWPGDLVVSSEAMAGASAAQAAALVRRLEDAGREVHVVVTGRDLARQLAAGWQEAVKLRVTSPLAEWVDHVRAGRLPVHHLDAVSVAERWSTGLPDGRVHLVPVPGSAAPRTLLWERVAAVLGLEPDRFDVDVPRVNSSLGLEQAELLRRVNLALGERLPRAAGYGGVVKQLYAHRVLEGRAGRRIALAPDDLELGRRLSAAAVERLRAAGHRIDVVGDPGELLVPAGTAGEDQEPPGEQALALEATGALRDLLACLDRL